MKKGKIVVLYFLLQFIAVVSDAQCIFKDTLLKIDFGTNTNPQEFSLGTLRNYQRMRNNCPDDGYYSYSTETANCFNGDWITLKEDHTPGDRSGRMFFVNASHQASVFFITKLAGFKPNTTYEFSLWMMNLCRINTPCPPLPPEVVITLETVSGRKLISFQTGLIVSVANPAWKRYYSLFTTPEEAGILVLKMEDRTNGGCGNDFVMDDITIRECYKPDPPPVPVEARPPSKPEQKPAPTITRAVKPVEREKQKPSMPVAKAVLRNTINAPLRITKAKPAGISLPDVIVSRENPVIKVIETGPADMILQLYDNGQVDGDTVSIYHNNELIVSHAALSEKPVSFHIKVDAMNPHHELIMVADNLGSIPPNTSLMVITANGKRYEVFISSSEQKNAKLLIDLKE